MNAHEWKQRGAMRRIGQHELFYVDTGATRGGGGGDGGGEPALIILHGYPTSSYDYWRALPALSERRRVVVHDHLGFGFSHKPREYSYSLIEQADHALALWQSLGIGEADLLAHDYGTSVATEIVARKNQGALPVALRSLTLCNGSMHIELARLRPIQRLLRSRILGPVVSRLASERVFRRNMRNLFSDPSVISDDELAVMWSQLTGGGGRAVLPRVTRYLDERYKFWHRWIGALRETDLPVHIVWARNDPVAVEKMAHVLHDEIANSRLTLLDDLGHFPMLEAPDRWADAVLDGLAG